MKNKDKLGNEVLIDDYVQTIFGKINRVCSIDADGYARLAGEISTNYLPHCLKMPIDD